MPIADATTATIAITSQRRGVGSSAIESGRGGRRPAADGNPDGDSGYAGGAGGCGGARDAGGGGGAGGGGWGSAWPVAVRVALGGVEPCARSITGAGVWSGTEGIGGSGAADIAWRWVTSSDSSSLPPEARGGSRYVGRSCSPA